MNRVRFPWPAAALALAACCAWLATDLRLENDVGRMLPDGEATLARTSEALRAALERTVVDVSADDPGVDPGPAADALAAALRASPHVASARSRVDFDAAFDLAALLRERAPLLLDESAWDDLSTRLRPENVLRTLRDLERRLQEPEGDALKSRVAVDPLGLTDAALRPLEGLAAGVSDVRLRDGRLTSRDGRHVLVLVSGVAPATDTERGAAFLAALDDAIASLRTEHPGVRVAHAGSQRASRDNETRIRADVSRTSAVGAGIVVLLALLCLGRPRLALLALLPALFGGVVALGVLALLRDAVAAPVLGFGVVLLGLTVDFAVHVLFRRERDGDAPLPVRAIVMGAITTAAAFAVLLGSSLPGVRDIGLFGAVGVPAAALCALLVLPRLAGRPRAGRGPVVDLARLIPAARVRTGVRTVVALVIVTPLLAFGVTRLRFDGDVTHLSSLSPAAAADEASLRAAWGDVFRVTQLVLQDADLQAALRRNDDLAALLDEQVRASALDGHLSVAGILPSRATQERRLAAWRARWTGDVVASLRDALAAAADATRFRADAFAPFFAWLAAEPAFVVHTDLAAGPGAALLAERVRRGDDGLWHVTTPVLVSGAARVDDLAAMLAEHMPDVTVVNAEAYVRRVARLVRSEMGLLGALTFAAVALLVGAWIGRPGLTLVVLAPLVLSLAWTLGLLGWIGQPLNLVNAIFVVFLFGIAVDYAIFLASARLEWLRTGVDRQREAAASVLLCALTTSTGFGALALAEHPVLRSIGVAAGLGIASAALVTLALVPMLSAALLVRPGPNGTPALRNVIGALAVARYMLLDAFVFLRLRRRRDDAPDAGRAARARIAVMARHTRHDIPGGRVLYVGDGATAFARPGILVANHESMYDIAALLALPTSLRMVVKPWVWDAPLIGDMVRAAGFVLLRGGGGDGPREPVPGGETHTLREQVRAALAAGDSVAIFPEGTRRRRGGMRRFRNGAFALARELDVPVLPVALVNTREVVPVGTWWVGDHDARVVVLAPLDPRDFTGEFADRRMAAAARGAIAAAVRIHWPDTVDGPCWWRVPASGYRYLGPCIGHYAASKLRRDPLVRHVARALPGRGSVLVAGAGYGLLTARLALADPERPLTAVDRDARKLRVAERALGDLFPVRFVAADLRDADVPVHDAAVLADVLHYWPPAEQDAIVSRLAALVRPGGRLVFRDACAAPDWRHALNSSLERVAVAGGFTRGAGAFHYRDEPGWTELLARHGFDVVERHPEWGLLSNAGLLCVRR